MMGGRSTGLVPTMLLLASFLPWTAAKTTTVSLPKGLPASCTPLATLLSEYPPPTDGKAVDDALNSGITALYSRYAATATAESRVSLNLASRCDFIISTQIPSATPSVTSALSSYISAAGIWLEDHGLDEAKSLLSGDCIRAVQPEDEIARGALDFVIAFGQCYKLLGWDERMSASSDATTTTTTTTTTTDASSTPVTTATLSKSGSTATQATPSPTSQASEVDAPPSDGSMRMTSAFWILGMTVCVIALLSR